MRTTLKRSITLPLITLYGLGNILGAGIYVLIGKVAGEAGYLSPISFMIASFVALVSAFSYAELSARYPVSAGEAVYIYEGFHNQHLAQLVGTLIILAGIVSCAAITHGFAGYVRVLIDLPQQLIFVVLITSLCALAIWGIEQSVKVAAFLTLIEIFGLLLICIVGIDSLSYDIGSKTDEFVTTSSKSTWMGVFSGAFLAFYAYIGFEDMVNVAEEVQEPEKNMPKAILLCVLISCVLYGAVSWVSVSVATPSELMNSRAPLALVYEKATGDRPIIITFIGLFAVINGALIQIIMASRLVYGMARRRWLPQFLVGINATTRTPIYSTVLVSVLVCLFAIVFPLMELAQLTSYLILFVFALVNLALIRIKNSQIAPPSIGQYSIWVPRSGFILTVSLVALQTFS